MNVAPENPSNRHVELSAGSEGSTVSPLLNEEVLVEIKTSLGQGMSGFARQGDIVELHKRIGEKFALLPEEVGKQFADAIKSTNDATAALQADIASVAKDLNGLEGAVRIELAPLIEEMVRNSVNAATLSRSRFPLVLGVLISLLVGTVAGAYWQAELSSGFHDALHGVQRFAEDISG